MLSKTTGGPEIQGPYARMGAANACDFDSIRKMQQDGVRTRENGTLHLTVAEAKAKGGGGSCQPDPSCIAAFLAAAEPFTYMHCSAPPHLCFFIRHFAHELHRKCTAPLVSAYPSGED